MAFALSAGPDLASLYRGASCGTWAYRPIDLQRPRQQFASDRSAAATGDTARGGPREHGSDRELVSEIERTAADYLRQLRREHGRGSLLATDSVEWISGRWSGCTPRDAAHGRTSVRQSHYYARLIVTAPDPQEPGALGTGR